VSDLHAPAETTIESQEAAVPVEPAQPVAPTRYSLRERRAQPGRWASKRGSKEYGLHITATKAIKSHGEAAVTAMLLELEQMLEKKVWRPVDTSKLSYQERKTIIIS